MKHSSYLILACCLALATGCELQETNIDPNVPVDVPLQTLLPPAEQSVANFLSGDAAVIAGIFSQYFVGFDALVQPLDRYVVDNDFFMRPIWQDLYATSLVTLDLIVEKAETQQSPHYAGVGKTLLALCLGAASSLWGDIPYSEALQGDENLNPAYDSQEIVYQEVQRLLEEAIVDLSAEESVFSPGDDDLLLGGNLERWKKAASTLKARFYLHIVKRSPSAAEQALNALAEGIDDPAGDLRYTYNAQEFNPWFRYQQSTPNIRIDPLFRDLVDDDPREGALIKVTFGEARIGPFYASETSPLFLISYVEARFLEAEALLRTAKPGAQQALDEAVRTHIDLVTGGETLPAEIDDYLAANVQLTGSLEEDLQIVLTQKHIASFTTIEGWTDFRRTGYPILPPNADGLNPQNPNGEIPRRFPYPLSEELFNAQVPTPLPGLQDRFWWDQ